MSSDRKALGARLRGERLWRGWLKPEMARRLAEHLQDQCPDQETLISYLKRWEAGKTGISERYRLAYAAAFAVEVEELFGLDGRSPWRAPGLTEMMNREFSPDAEERLGLAVARPSRMDADVLDTLRTVLTGQRRLEDAIGPAALLQPVTRQLESITAMLRNTSGPHRRELGRIVAEWTTFTGWLHAAVRRDAAALRLFRRAEELADEVGDGTLAGTAVSFKGYVARQQGRPRAVVHASAAALATPGGHLVQQTFDRLQAAQGYAACGEVEQARRMLGSAAERADDGIEPPPSVYWYSPSFFRLNIGLVLREIGEHRDAADLLAEGLAGIPVDQQEAEWLAEYRDAYQDSRGRA
ncbi:helix-turn-helix domain-containing protein [Actinomadura viridis]|uniref:helix-turn-helix domain-containing protein n=1 Tax=Actinomadura viridis TaxID=58110 RepID=UPI00367AD5BE